MIEIIHRVNHIDQLKKIPYNYGLEIDIRSENNNLVLAHDLHESKNDFKEFLKFFKHELLVANIKESGIEEDVINELFNENITNFFLLDVEPPFIIKNFNKYGNNLSLRFSKYEAIDTVQNFVGKVKWVWVDTYGDFDLNVEKATVLKNFKLCLVSPSRWGYENKINYYLDKFQEFDLLFDAVMVESDQEINLKTSY